MAPLHLRFTDHNQYLDSSCWIDLGHSTSTSATAVMGALSEEQLHRQRSRSNSAISSERQRALHVSSMIENEEEKKRVKK